MAYAYLVDPQIQFQTKSGTLNVAGTLRVYDAATDDVVITYKDFNGTENEASIRLDNNGRAIVIADADKVYRLEVYDRYGSLLWTVSPLWCIGTGGGGIDVHGTDIISTDGSLVVAKTEIGSQTVFDLGIAPQSDEFLEWMDSDPVTVTDGDNVPDMTDGTMTETGSGVAVYKDRFYHVTNSFTVTPTGSGIAYDTLTVSLMFTDGNTPVTLVTRAWDIDNSLTDPVECEFSYDVKPSADGYLYWTISGASAFSSVSGQMQIHRIYSGVNAVPDTCATKQWVSANYQPQSSMSSYVQYSAIEHNSSGQVTGINGSSIVGGLDSATVSAIASSYAESAASGKLDNSASSTWYPMTGNPSGFINSSDLSSYATTAYVDSSVSSKVDQSAFDDCCSAMSSNVSSLQQDVSSISAAVSAVTGQTGNYIEWSDSGVFQPSGSYVSASDMSSYIPFSGLAGSGNVITSISGSSIGSTSTGGKTYTGIWPVVVDNTADTVAVENKTLAVDETMTGYESAGSAVIGVNTGVVLSGLTAYQPASAMSAYAYESSLSSKLDTTAFSTVSGDFLTSHQSLAGYATESYVDSSVSGKLDATASSQFLTSLPADLAYTSDVASAVSSKLDASASSDFYPMSGNPSGFLTAHQSLAGYATEQYVDSSVSSKVDSSAYDSAWFQPASAMTAYQLSGDYAFNSSLSSKLDASASSQFQPSGNYIYASSLGTGTI